MNPKIKEIWVAALRSGKYPQGRRALRSNEGFCCLGVLCDLHSQETGHNWEYHSIKDGRWIGTYFSSGDTCPAEVRMWAGLTCSNPIIDSQGAIPLSFINDDGATFEEIANLIEAEL